jgi:gliding motility-associated-like protein
LTSVAGCDSIVTTILDVVPVLMNTVNAEICAGGSYTLPDGSTVTTAGSYDVTLTSVAGCDSIVTTILDIIPIVTNTVNAEICAGGSYTLPDGSIVTTAESYDVTLTSVAGCDSIVTTVLIVNPVYNIAVNAQICNGQSYTLPNGTSVNTSGSYIVTLPTISGCDSIVTTTLDVVPVLTNTINAEICAGGSYTLPDGSTVTTAGSYDVTLTSVAGCDSIVTTILDVVPVYTILVNAEICSGNSYVLPDGVSVNSSGSYTVTLNTIAGCDSTVITQLIVLPVFITSVSAEICGNETYTLPNGTVVNSSGNYPVVLTATNGCDSTVITVLNVIPIFNINQNITICQGESYLLPNGTSANGTGVYPVTLISSLGCDSTVVTNLNVINVIPQIVNNTGTTILTCSTPAISLTASGGLTYQWNNGLGNTASVTINTPGTYTVNAVGPNGCSVSASIVITQDITVPIAGIVNLTGDNELTCALTSINLQATGNGTYLWNNGLGTSSIVNIVSPGTYTVLVTGSNGCTNSSSIEILQDIEEPAPTYFYYELCQGEILQLQDGTTADGTGVYNVILQAWNGCDSLIVNELLVHPTFIDSIEVVICPGTPYTLPNGTEVSESGAYPVQYQTTFGCDSTFVFVIEELPVYNFTQNVTICSGDSYQLPDGNMTSVVGGYQYTYQSINGCDSITTIQLSIQEPYTVTNHILLCEGESYTLPDGSVVASSGYFPIALPSVLGCDSLIISHISIINSIPTYVAASVCSGSLYTLPDGVAASEAGVYQSVLTSINGCDSLVFTTLSVDSPVAMGILPLGDTLSICYGDSIFLQAFGGSSYNWVPSSGLANPIGSANWVGPENSTTYVVNGANGSCVGSDSVYVEILPIPEVHIVADDIFVCEGDSILITVTGADSYEWASNPLIECDTCQNFMIVPNGTITIEVTGDLEGCQATELLELGIMPNPVTIISGDSILCGEEITTLTALGATNYIWNTGDTTTTITVSPDDDEIFSVMGSLGNCVFADDILIEVYDYPEIDAGNDTLINMGDVVTLNPIGALSYSWYPDGTLSCLECEHPDAAPSVTTVYCVEGYNEFGCADTSCIKIEVTIDCPTFFIPNAFAPEEGGDEANNCFRIYGEDCFEEFVLRVYDRWGEVVFETTDSENCWDGNFAGKEMNSGVFVYYLDAVLLTGEPFIRKGNVTLIR